MDSAKNQLADKLKSANNILVTVSRDPSVDQLSACLGLTLFLNKAGKHAAAVFSGEVPSTIEFLQPESTLEKNTDSLRDFIIALDKSKADKLRYKVEDNVVRIFITPYKTSISEDDLVFSEGDFNVDVVVALGVHQQEDLDDAITAHGRILHDATVASITNTIDGGLGSINWHDNQASSLSELTTELVQAIDPSLIDNQIATSLLTGIVAETDRFSNDKTSSQTMSASAALMTAGANQQLVASKLEEHLEENQPAEADNQPAEAAKNDDGTLEIDHQPDENAQPEQKSEDQASQVDQPKYEPFPKPDAPQEAQQPPAPQPETPEAPEQLAAPELSGNQKLVTEPPSLGGTLTANSKPEGLDPSTDPFSMPASENPQILNRSPNSNNQPAMSPAPVGWNPPSPQQPVLPPDATLTDLETAVGSPHVAGLDNMRDDVNRALAQNPSPNDPPIAALNAQPLGGNLHESDQSATAPEVQADPNTPPPVPPPIPFQFGTPPSNNQQNQQ